MFQIVQRLRDKLKTRRLQGRGRRVWFPLTVAGLLLAFWLAPGAEGRASYRHGRAGAGVDTRSLSDLAADLREHPSWAGRVGLTVSDVQRIAGLLEEKNAQFDAYRVRRADLTDRAAEVLGAAATDPDQLLVLRAETQRLTMEVADETLMLMVRVVEDLSPEQRVEILRHWGDR